MDACVAYLRSSPVTEYPIDGYGGSYYDFWFPVPDYIKTSSQSVHRTSWHQIDDYYKDMASNVIGSAVSFGVCLVTLLNIVVLTPQPRRRLPLHNFICLALICQIVRNMTQMIILTRSLPASSYIYLTNDQYSTSLSHTYYALLCLSQASTWLSFVFVQACFFIQGRALMTWLHLHHRLIYFSILVYLVLAGFTATAYRFVLGIYQVLYARDVLQSATTGMLLQGTIILYAVSIGSWSLVFFVSAASIIVNRRRALFKGNSIYDAALNLIAIICLESFIVPIFLCIIQYPAAFELPKLVNPEQLIVPSVLFLLPIGSLFLTVHGKASVTQPVSPVLQNARRLENAVRPVKPDNARDFANDVSQLNTSQLCTPTLNTASARPLSISVAVRPVRGIDYSEVELASIDAMSK